MTSTTFSLLNVCTINPDGTVDGYWLQDHVGSRDGAIGKATATSAVNSNINVAVVEQINHPTPMLELWTGRRTVWIREEGSTP